MGKRYVWIIRRVYLIWHINGYHKRTEVAFDMVKPVHRTKKDAVKYIKEKLNHTRYEVKKYEEV